MLDDDGLYVHLPRWLQLRPVLALLMPGPSTPPLDRPLYPMRMTVLVVAHLLFWVQALMFAGLGHGGAGLCAAGGTAATALAMLLLRRNFRHPALTLGLGAVFAYLGALHWLYGIASSTWLFIFPIAIGSFFVYRREEWRLLLLPLGLCIGVCGLVVFPVGQPARLLTEGEARFLLAMHAVGSLYATFVLASHAYMVAGGLPEPCEDHLGRAIKMALEMHSVVAAFALSSGHSLALRIGINTGPVTAGVIGKNKFAYDLWGDTVNVASRMESHGEPGKIQVTRAVYEQLKDRYAFVERGSIEVKGKGPMETWLL